MLVLCRMKQNFFTVASAGLYFGLELESVLMIQGVSLIAEQQFHSVKAFSASHPSQPVREEERLHKDLGGGKDRTADPN